MKIVRITDWDELLTVIQKFVLWGFRGQSDSSWGLTTTFERQLNQSTFYDAYSLSNNKMAWHKEYRMLRNFMRRASYYTNHLPSDSELFEWLSLMQHHGAPTRLLDFSHSFYIASFFALENATNDAAIWAVNLDKLRRKCMSNYNINSSNTNIDQFNLLVLPIANKMIAIEGNKIESLPTSVINIEPEKLHERIINQQGLFLFPTDISKSFEENLGLSPKDHKIRSSKLKDVSPYEDFIIKFVIPYELKEQILKSLNDMNINSRTLFPGLDGFARSMQLTMLGP